MPSIYLVNPATSAPGYHTAEAFTDDKGGWSEVADLTTATVAALVPDGWSIRLTDEAVSPADLDADVDFVAITGKVSQRQRMSELAAEFRRRGRTVLIGGSFATLSPHEMRPHADILVTGEIEQIAPKLFADLAAGSWETFYDGGQADIRVSPVPRWDLYPVHRAMSGALQTTRGCPFNCEFCDVIQYQGRKQRHKTVPQLMKELSALHAYGFRDVFLVDDNFTVHRRWAWEVLESLAGWNAGHADDPVRFVTQASMDVARDTDLLDLCRTAGLRTLFMGIETTNEESLRQAGKKQNLLMPMKQAVERVVSRGIAIKAGVIIGFDQDGPEIFAELLDFFDNSPLPDLSIGVLTAPFATDLYRRLQTEGRLVHDDSQATAGTPFATNIVPKLMDRETLLEGTLKLTTELYRPHRFEKRMVNLIEAYGDEAIPRVPQRANGEGRRRQSFGVFQAIAARGRAEANMVANILRRVSGKPALVPTALHFLTRYEQARLVLDHASSLRPSHRLAG